MVGSKIAVISFGKTLRRSKRRWRCVGGWDTLFLFDSDTQGNQAAKDIIRSKLIPKKNVIMIGDITKSKEADVEDLLSDDVYEALVKAAYKAELAGKALSLNTSIPRLVKRYDTAFKDQGLSFSKARPAKQFIKLVADKGMAGLDTATKENVGALFDAINGRLPDAKPVNAKIPA